jgi:tetratricopeptide (TPR) repeat protein
MTDSQDLLQHPRRNLGNRYRTMAQKFAKLAKADPQRAAENLAWAEQNARQALLHDFTDERNWRCLVELKVANNDSDGLHAVLEDVFSVLGRDPEQVDQLKGIDFITHGPELLEATFANDSLDPDTWWSQLQGTSTTETLELFVERCKRLDFSDQRANIVYGRRLERVKHAGHVEVFIELARHLLAHRPMNHELWQELGRLHERRGEMDHAWSCYDQVQQLRPHHPERDRFLDRLKGGMDGDETVAWSGPSIDHREAFLRGMQTLTDRISTVVEQAPETPEEAQVEPSHPDEANLRNLVEQGDLQAAFFLARRLVASGEDWAVAWIEDIQARW